MFTKNEKKSIKNTTKQNKAKQQYNIHLYFTSYSSADRIFMNFTYFFIVMINNLFAKF